MALSGGGHPARTARSRGREGRIHPRRIGVQQSRRTTLVARSPAWMITKETPAAALAFRRMRRRGVVGAAGGLADLQGALAVGAGADQIARSVSTLSSC